MKSDRIVILHEDFKVISRDEVKLFAYRLRQTDLTFF